MKLDKFKLAALAKSTALEYKYEIVCDVERINLYEYIIKFNYEEIPLYFRIMGFNSAPINSMLLKTQTTQAIKIYEDILNDPAFMKQVKYLDSQAELIYSKEKQEQGGIFDKETVNKMENQIDTLLDANKRDFAKTYKELISKEFKNKVFKTKEEAIV